MKTENLGIEKVVANVVSNPRIRFLVVAGTEIRGHRSGGTLLALHRNGFDSNGRIVSAPGAVPYIENLTPEAVERFRAQIETVDLVGVADRGRVIEALDGCASRDPGSFGEPFVAIEIKERKRKAPVDLAGSISLYRDFTIGYTGKISPLCREG